MNNRYVINDVLYLELPFQLDTLLELTLTEELNEHTFGRLRGYISEHEERSIMELDDTSELCICLNSQEQELTLFAGLLLEIQIRHRHQTELCVTFASHSIVLDWEKKTRSFQRGETTFQKVIKEIIGEYNGDFLDCTGQADAYQAPLIQYRETDWEFIRRLGALCQKPVYPSVNHRDVRLYMGIRRLEAEPVEADSVALIRHLAGELQFQEHAAGSLMACRFRTRMYLAMGKPVTYQGINYCITKNEAEWTQGELMFTYTVGRSETVMSGVCPEASGRAGLMHTGTVTAVKKDKIQLHLDMDKEQSPADAYWYPWHRNDWFCMPEIGSQAVLLCPEADERTACVVAACHPADKETGKQRLPEVKQMETAAGNGWMMTPDSLRLYAGEDAVYLQMSESGGVQFESDKSISIQAGTALEIGGKTVRLKAQDNICLMTGNTCITMDEIIQLKG